MKADFLCTPLCNYVITKMRKFQLFIVYNKYFFYFLYKKYAIFVQNVG